MPNGSEVFITGFTSWDNHNIQVPIYQQNVKKMLEAEGSFKCTLTILDTDSSVTRSSYMSYGFLTVLPFTVIVHKGA